MRPGVHTHEHTQGSGVHTSEWKQATAGGISEGLACKDNDPGSVLLITDTLAPGTMGAHSWAVAAGTYTTCGLRCREERKVPQRDYFRQGVVGRGARCKGAWYANPLEIKRASRCARLLASAPGAAALARH